MDIHRFSSREECLAGLTPLGGAGSGPILYSEYGTHYQSLTQGHTLVVGQSGAGKTTSVTQSAVCGALTAGRAAVVLDAKGTVYEATRGLAEQQGYQQFCVDLSRPHSSPDSFNPLREIYEHLSTGNSLRVSWACEDIHELAEALVPLDEKDPYWHHSGVELISAIIHTVCEKGRADEANLASVLRVLTEGNAPVAKSTNLKQLFEFLEPESLGKRLLTTYVHAPQSTTAASIFAVSNTSIGRLIPSPLMERFLAAESFSLSDIDLARPFIIWIIVPDESVSAYLPLAAALLNQIVRHLLRAARHRYHGALPVPVTVVVEELASMGRCIPQLPELLSSSRSRGLNMLLCLQSLSQLDMLYGEDRGTIIRDNVETLIAFAGKDPGGLERLAASCGSFAVRTHTGVIRRPVVTADRLAALAVGQVLVQRPGGVRYITRLPRFDEAYSLPKPAPETMRPRAPYRVFSLDAFIRQKRKEHLDSLLDKNSFPPLAGDWDPGDKKKVQTEKKNEADLDAADFSVLLEMKEQHLRRRRTEWNRKEE